MSVTELNHPLAKVIVSRLQDKHTQASQFRIACKQITQLLAIEATQHLKTTPITVSTPLEDTEGNVWNKGLTIVPIIRAGIGMVEPILEYFPEATVGYIGMERDEASAKANSYYFKIPPSAENHTLVIDPMLATGGSAIQTIDRCIKNGATTISMLSIIASPEGITAMQNKHPEVDIFVAKIDRELNEQKYILPGLGDFGDRLYNT